MNKYTVEISNVYHDESGNELSNAYLSNRTYKVELDPKSLFDSLIKFMNIKVKDRFRIVLVDKDNISTVKISLLLFDNESSSANKIEDYLNDNLISIKSNKLSQSDELYKGDRFITDAINREALRGVEEILEDYTYTDYKIYEKYEYSKWNEPYMESSAIIIAYNIKEDYIDEIQSKIIRNDAGILILSEKYMLDKISEKINKNLREYKFVSSYRKISKNNRTNNLHAVVSDGVNSIVVEFEGQELVRIRQV